MSSKAWPPRQYDDTLGRDTEWQDSALCAETDPEAFFPEKGMPADEPKRVCRNCKVRAECLEYALEHGIRFGVWGGLSERERRRLLAQQVRHRIAA